MYSESYKEQIIDEMMKILVQGRGRLKIEFDSKLLASGSSRSPPNLSPALEFSDF